MSMRMRVFFYTLHVPLNCSTYRKPLEFILAKPELVGRLKTFVAQIEQALSSVSCMWLPSLFFGLHLCLISVSLQSLARLPTR